MPTNYVNMILKLFIIYLIMFISKICLIVKSFSDLNLCDAGWWFSCIHPTLLISQNSNSGCGPITSAFCLHLYTKIILIVFQVLGMRVAQNATAKIEDVSKQVLNRIPVATLQVMVQ